MKNIKKKIIFLDGDGTLWYPKKTLRTQKPHWIYLDPETKDNYLEHLMLTPQTKETLEKLHKKGYLLVVISANPYEEDVAIKEIKERLEHFGLVDFFYSIRSSEGDNSEGKAAIILEIIEKLGFSKDDALMVGDSYFYDYLAPKNAGIDAFFIQNSVSKMPEIIPDDIQSINEISDLLEIID